MAAMGEDIIHSLTTVVCVLSQQQGGSDITLFADNDGIEKARRGSQKKGMLDGKELSQHQEFISAFLPYAVFTIANSLPVLECAPCFSESPNLASPLCLNCIPAK